jgi:hypothetical protein
MNRKEFLISQEIKRLKRGNLINVDAGTNHKNAVMFLLRYKGTLSVRAINILTEEYEVITISENKYKGRYGKSN